jgi:hypothetical protein
VDFRPIPPPSSQAGPPAPGAPVAPAAGGGPAAGAPASAPDTSLLAREPAITQGIAASLLAAVALFGIQGPDNATDIALSTLVAALPLVGALFVRGRVQPLPRSTASTHQ